MYYARSTSSPTTRHPLFFRGHANLYKPPPRNVPGTRLTSPTRPPLATLPRRRHSIVSPLSDSSAQLRHSHSASLCTKKALAASPEKAALGAHARPKTPVARHPPPPKDIPHHPPPRSLSSATHGSVSTGSTPSLVFQHIHEIASKRISTLDYLRKAHEGRIYWFNTLLFSKPDLARLPSFTQRNQARRATHYLLLGFSLPNILDLNTNSPADYLKALNALLLEFEQYQSIHPADGAGPSTLSRARIPHMFKRANLNMGSKGRRTSSAANDFPLFPPGNTTSFSSFNSDLGALDPAASPETDLLLPNESYTHLQTPSLPFEPDFFNTFATLCDVLIDCYTRILTMLNTPESIVVAGSGVPSIVGDLFTKADARVRKIILAGVVREFEDSCRAGLKSEVGGVGKVVLGGLM